MYDWVDVGDARVCPTCKARAAEPAKLFQDWENTPGDGQSECGGKCRCIFLPHEIISMDTSFEGSKTILLELEKQGAKYPTAIHFEEAVFKQVDELVGEYERLSAVYYEVGDWNLPNRFYAIHDGIEKREFLEKLIGWVKSGRIPDNIRADILKTNAWWMRGRIPARR